MTFEEAKAHLLETTFRNSRADISNETIQYNGSPYVSWQRGNSEIVLDGHFTVKDLEALVVVMKDHEIE